MKDNMEKFLNKSKEGQEQSNGDGDSLASGGTEYGNE